MLALVTAVTEDELQLRTTEQDVAIAIGDSEPGHYDRIRVGMTIAIESDDETGAVSIGEAAATREELLAFWQAVGAQEAPAAPADTLLKALAKNPASQIATTTHLLHILRRLAEIRRQRCELLGDGHEEDAAAWAETEEAIASGEGIDEAKLYKAFECFLQM